MAAVCISAACVDRRITKAEFGCDTISDELRQELQTLIPELLGWESFEVAVLHGGFANVKYRVTSSGGDTAVVRVFGPQPHFFRRDREAAICEALHRQSFGSEVLGVFGNGRIESFIEGRSLQLQDGSRKPEMGLPRFFPSIARRLGEFHRCRIDCLPQTHEEGWENWFQLMDEAAASRPEDPEKAGRFDALAVPELAREFRSLVERLTNSSAGRPLVPTHHDLNWGNMMVVEEPGAGAPAAVQLIDYEYVAYNFQAVDIATHFQWYLGTGPSFTMEDYPSEEQQHAFIAAYLHGFKGDSSATEVEAMFREVQRWSLATWLSIAAWQVAKAMSTPFLFDFMMSCAEFRVAEYRRLLASGVEP